MIYGNKEGIRDSLLLQMESLYEIELGEGEFAPNALVDALATFTEAVRREISVYISRDGEVLDVTIGELNSVKLKDLRLRRNARRLSRVRCVHTHPGGDARLSDVDLSSLRALRFDAMTAVGVREGRATGVQTAFLGPCVSGDPQTIVTDVVPAHSIPQKAWMDAIERADSEVLAGAMTDTREEQERAFLVGLDSERSLAELARLAQTAGAVVVGGMLQRKTRPDAATYIGSGKADELSLACQAKEAGLVIFDDELTGVQLRNLEDALPGVKVIDRTALILDIFAQRAQSREGRLQVELAQAAYQLPRLSGKGLGMSRLGGGIGTRGPGETQLEMDRRRIRKRIAELRLEIDGIGKQRALRRSRREKHQIPVVALVGYTNAGKSTLLNRLSGACVPAEDKLFATLDPVVRTVKLPDGGEFLLVDTVGFISKLPHTLIDAFRSTLEETLLADLLLIVNDGASEEMAHQHDVVMNTLSSLGASDQPRIDVVNKCDLCASVPVWPGAIPISAKTGQGIDALLHEIRRQLRGTQRHVRVRIPYRQGALIARLHEDGKVLGEAYEDEGIRVEALIDERTHGQLASLLGEQAIERIESDRAI